MKKIGQVYSADEFINKTLIAQQKVPVYRDATDIAKPVYYVDAGQPVGIVYSWLSPMAGRSQLWWMFEKSYLDFYYTPHVPARFNWPALKEQGVLSTEEKIEEEKKKDRPWYENLILNYGPWVLGALLAGAAIRGYFSRPKN